MASVSLLLGSYTTHRIFFAGSSENNARCLLVVYSFQNCGSVFVDVKGKNMRSRPSGRKNVMSMRERLCPDPLAGSEKMAGFQIFFCLKI